MSDEKNTKFDYMLNVMERAGQEKYPAKAGYAGKRKALLAHVRELERKAAMADQLAPVLAFLAGEAPLDGVWFGDRHPTEKGAFWWRKHLRTAGAPEAPAPKPVAMIEAADARRLADELEKLRCDHWTHWSAQENHVAATAVRHLRLLAEHNAPGVGVPQGGQKR